MVRPCLSGARRSAVESLLTGVASDSCGEISISIYDTARLVAFVPWLIGHAARMRFLVLSQQRSGWWGGEDDYCLLPTLSATEALLTSIRRAENGADSGILPDILISAADRGLRVLFARFNSGRTVSLPDTVAVEILVPALVADINDHLDQLGSQPLRGLEAWRGSTRLALPDYINGDSLVRLRDSVRRGQALPTKLAHSLEAMGGLAHGLSSIQPVRGSVGCSPSATAAWLGTGRSSAAQRRSVAYLEAVQDRHGGPVPVCAPVPVFERSWVTATLLDGGVRAPIPSQVIKSLEAALGEAGAAAGPGLPPDSDDTAMALYALTRAGFPRSPDCLWSYRVGEHFSSFGGERTWSTSANAHVLQAFGAYLADSGERLPRYLGAIRQLSSWLSEQQRPDGSWADKWHASRYYATACCTLALAHYGGNSAAHAVRKAAEWILDTQRGDGSWGRWQGTREETAYALRILLAVHRPRQRGGMVEQAVAQGCVFLLRSDPDQRPPLWHDKDLYTPVRVVDAEVFAALSLASTRSGVAALIERRLPCADKMAGMT
jgi:hypothetical protein